MAERVDEASLPFAVLPVARSLVRLGASATSGFEDSVDIVDPEHHLVSRRGRTLTISVLTYDQFGALTVEAKLRAMTRTDADVLHEAQYVRVPGHRFSHVGDG